MGRWFCSPLFKGGYTEVMMLLGKPNPPLTPLTPLGKGGTRGSRKAPLLLGEGLGRGLFRAKRPMPKLPTGRQGYCIGGLVKDLRSRNFARLNLRCVGEGGCCLEELF